MARTKKIVSTKKKTTPNSTFSKKTAEVKKAPAKMGKELFTNPVIKILATVLLLVGLVALIDLGVQYLNNDYSVAIVNGHRVSKSKWYQRLEKGYGSSVANQLINDQIVEQEAKKLKVTVEDAEVDAKVNEIKVNIGGEEVFNNALKVNNVSLQELKDQIKIDLLYTKIISSSISYTEDDLKNFFNQYSGAIFQKETEALKEGEKLDYETYKERVKEAYILQEADAKRDNWLKTKKEEYRIQDNTTNKPKYGFLTTLINIFNNITEKPVK